MIKKPLFIISIAILLTSCTGPTPKPAIKVQLQAMTDVEIETSFETVEQGFQAGTDSYRQRSIHVFDDQSGFGSFYTALLWPNAPTVPSIDFDKYRVIALVDDVQSSSGYSTEIISLENVSRLTYQVNARFSRPGASEYNLEVMTHPYHIVKVRKKN